jgi:hypothetical protein
MGGMKRGGSLERIYWVVERHAVMASVIVVVRTLLRETTSLEGLSSKLKHEGGAR